MDYVIVTVVDSISTTSMPVNEFVLYRNKKNESEQILISCSESLPENILMPPSLPVYLVGRKIGNMRKVLIKIKKECLKKGLKMVIHLHAPKSALLFFESSLFLGLRKYTLFTIHSTYSGRDFKYKFTSSLCSIYSNYVSCVSNASYDEYSSFVKHWKGNKMIAIQNGVDSERILKAINGLPQHVAVADKFKLVCVGRMIPIKNQQFLIRLLKYLPETELILIGKEDDMIVALAKDEGVENRVSITGLIPRDEVFKSLNDCGIYVSASLVEGMPVSVLEAMCVGLIPILSNIIPHEEVAKECLLFHTLPLKTELWVQTIQSYQSLSSEEFFRLSTNIKQIVVKNFSLESMHNKYNEIYALLAK